jgi:hypothetical protein
MDTDEEQHFGGEVREAETHDGKEQTAEHSAHHETHRTMQRDSSTEDNRAFESDVHHEEVTVPAAVAALLPTAEDSAASQSAAAVAENEKGSSTSAALPCVFHDGTASEEGTPAAGAEPAEQPESAASAQQGLPAALPTGTGVEDLAAGITPTAAQSPSSTAADQQALSELPAGLESHSNATAPMTDNSQQLMPPTNAQSKYGSATMHHNPQVQHSGNVDSASDSTSADCGDMHPVAATAEANPDVMMQAIDSAEAPAETVEPALQPAAEYQLPAHPQVNCIM